MALDTLKDWATYTLGPSISAILITLLLVITLPLFLHLYLYRQSATVKLPSFLLVGPSGSGKTSLLTHLEQGSAAKTRTSQTSLSVQVSLPADTLIASSQYRSVNDPSNKLNRRILVVDTPGHGKLRHYALENIVNPTNLKGIIFVVDATTLSSDSSAEDEQDAGLVEAAGYLHDILLTLQKRYTNAKSSKGLGEVPVLIAANKMDLFTALPPKLVKSSLEAEITKLRNTKATGLLDSGIGMDDDEERETLGGAGEGKFEFGLMEEYGIQVEVVGGNVLGGDGSDVRRWWEWIGKSL